MPLARIGEDSAKWLPVSVDKLDALLFKLVHRGCGYVYSYALRRNIAYNLQYLEFLDQCLVSIKLTEMLTIQIYKNFVCVGCGIIESLLEFLLIKNDFHKTTVWESVCAIKGQERKFRDKTIKIDCEIFEKLANKKKLEMSFDSMIKRAEARKLFGPDHGLYAKLQRLRKMRNRLHLHIIEEPTDTDWNAFKHAHLCSMANVLHSVFTGNLFRPSAEEKGYFNYLTESRYQPIETSAEFH